MRIVSLSNVKRCWNGNVSSKPVSSCTPVCVTRNSCSRIDQLRSESFGFGFVARAAVPTLIPLRMLDVHAPIFAASARAAAPASPA